MASEAAKARIRAGFPTQVAQMLKDIVNLGAGGFPEQVQPDIVRLRSLLATVQLKYFVADEETLT